MKKAFLLALVVTVTVCLWITGLTALAGIGDFVGDKLELHRYAFTRSVISFTSMVGYIVFTVVFAAAYSETKKVKKCK